MEIYVMCGCQIIFLKEFGKWRYVTLINYCWCPFVKFSIISPCSEAIKTSWSFSVIILMNCRIHANVYKFLLTRLRTFVTWESKSILLFKFTLNSFLSLLFLNDNLEKIHSGLKWDYIWRHLRFCLKIIRRVFCPLPLQSWTKYLDQIEEIEQNWTGIVNFDNCRNFVSGMKTWN